MEPLSGLIKPAISLTKVVFPLALFPIIESQEPFGIERLKLFIFISP